MGSKTQGRGRPSDYSEELAHEICETIAASNKGLGTLCRENEHWPHERTVRRWIRNNEDFCHTYARAKLDQADFLAEETLEISDYAARDTILIEKDGHEKEVCDHEWVNRSRLRVDTRKWYVSKLAPRIYGERTIVSKDDSEKVTVENLDINKLTPEEANVLICKILERFSITPK